MRYILFLSSSLILATASGAAIPVSPGAPNKAPEVADRCAAFSWAPEPGALAQRLLVFSLPEGQPVASLAAGLDNSGDTLTPVLDLELPAGAAGWSPPAAGCLEPGGRYGWVVGSRQDGGPLSLSTPLFFRVGLAPSEREISEALDVLRRAAASGGLGDDHPMAVEAEPGQAALQPTSTSSDAANPAAMSPESERVASFSVSSPRGSVAFSANDGGGNLPPTFTFLWRFGYGGTTPETQEGDVTLAVSDPEGITDVVTLRKAKAQFHAPSPGDEFSWAVQGLDAGENPVTLFNLETGLTDDPPGASSSKADLTILADGSPKTLEFKPDVLTIPVDTHFLEVIQVGSTTFDENSLSPQLLFQTIVTPTPTQNVVADGTSDSVDFLEGPGIEITGSDTGGNDQITWGVKDNSIDGNQLKDSIAVDGGSLTLTGGDLCVQDQALIVKESGDSQGLSLTNVIMDGSNNHSPPLNLGAHDSFNTFNNFTLQQRNDPVLGPILAFKPGPTSPTSLVQIDFSGSIHTLGDVDAGAVIGNFLVTDGTATLQGGDLTGVGEVETMSLRYLAKTDGNGPSCGASDTGRVYYDSEESILCFCNGTAFENLRTGTSCTP